MDVIRFAKEFVKLKPNRILFRVLSDVKVQQFIIDLNTIEQLFKEGIDSTGVKLSDIGGDYSPYTIDIKLAKNQPIDRITLLDEGDYYASYDIKPLANGDFEINSNPIKDGRSLEDDWGDKLEGLTDENTKKKDKYLDEETIKYIFSLLPINS